MKKIIYREFQTQDQDKIQSLVSIGLRNTAINQNLNIQARIEKYINEDYFDNVCLLCSEHQPHFCHRRLVAEYLKRYNSNLTINHLVKL